MSQRAVTRSVSFTLERSAVEGDGLTLSGYAAVFNSPTRIRGEQPREFDEVIAPGAFAQTIRQRKPVLMFDHGKHPLVGSLPIGQITTMREDARGLYIEAQLHDNWLVEPVRDAIKSGAIEGMSFRFSVPKDKETWDRSGEVPLRTLHEVNCAELGPVVFPAYTDTSVAVRSMIAALDDQTAVEVVQAFRAMSEDSDASEVAGIVDQIEALIAQLVVLEANELANGQDACGALSALLCVLSDLEWFEYQDNAMSEMPAEGMNSATDVGTSRRAAIRTLFTKQPPAEQRPDSTPWTPGERDRALRELILQGVSS